MLGRRTGIGRYVLELARALAADRVPGEQLTGLAVTLRGRAALADLLPDGFEVAGGPVPARALHRIWSRLEVPTVGQLAGRVDLFHGTNFVLPPAGRAAGVVTVHDLSFLHLPDTVSAASAAYRTQVPRSLARAEVVCVPSAAVRDEVLATYGTDPDRVVVTPLGVDPAWFGSAPASSEARDRLGLPADYLLFSGSLEPRKNLAFLLRVHRELRAADPGWPPLVLTGPAGWGPALELETHPPGSVVLTGYLTDDVLRGVVAGSRAVLYPSLYEGFGLPPLEAFATGTPVVASDLPVVREVVGTDRRLGDLVPVGDHDSWAQALLTAVHTPPDPGLAVLRRERAAAFPWSATAAATRSAYARAIRAR